MKYYTYCYLREDGTPYYIGKGSGKRIECSQGRPCSRPKNPSRVIKLKWNLTEEEAFRHETYMIFIFGRKIDGGILHNKTLGGEGVSGWKHREETREGFRKRGNIHLRTPEVRAKAAASRRGIKHTEEARKRISIAAKNRKPRPKMVIIKPPDGRKSKEYRDMVSKRMKGRKWPNRINPPREPRKKYLIIFPNGDRMIVDGRKKAAEVSGVKEASIKKILTGQYNKTRSGYKFEYVV